MNKKLTVLFLTVFIIIFVVSPLSAFALVRSGEGEAVLLQEGEFNIASRERVSFGSLSVAASTSEEFLHNELLEYHSEINLTSYRISVDGISAFYSNVINDNPDLFFVSSSFQYNYYPSSNTIAYIYPAYFSNEGK